VSHPIALIHSHSVCSTRSSCSRWCARSSSIWACRRRISCVGPRSSVVLCCVESRCGTAAAAADSPGKPGLDSLGPTSSQIRCRSGHYMEGYAIITFSCAPRSGATKLPTSYDVPRYSSEAAWRPPTQRPPHQEARCTQVFHLGRYASRRTQIASPQKPVQQRSEPRLLPAKDHMRRRATVCSERQMKCTYTSYLGDPTCVMSIYMSRAVWGNEKLTVSHIENAQ